MAVPGTSVASGSLVTPGGDQGPAGQSPSGAVNYWPTAGGTVNAITLTNSPALGALVNGATFTFPTVGSNTGAATAKVDGLAALPIRTPSNAALTGSELRTPLVTLIYANSVFYLAWTWSWWMPT